MTIVTSYNWENDTWTHNGDNPARTAWRDAVAEIAEKAKQTCQNATVESIPLSKSSSMAMSSFCPMEKPKLLPSPTGQRCITSSMGNVPAKTTQRLPHIGVNTALLQ